MTVGLSDLVSANQLPYSIKHFGSRAATSQPGIYNAQHQKHCVIQRISMLARSYVYYMYNNEMMTEICNSITGKQSLCRQRMYKDSCWSGSCYWKLADIAVEGKMAFL